MSAEFNPAPIPAGPRHIDPEDLSLYALKFLSGGEEAAIAKHLEHCAECRRELSLIQSDLATVAITVDMVAPSANARARLIKQVNRERKVIPIAAPEISAYGRSASVLSIEDAQPKRQVGRVILSISGWAAAACLMVSTAYLYRERQEIQGTIATQSGQIARLTADAANAHQLMDALTDPKAVRVSLSVKPAPKPAPAGGATYNPEKGTLIFLASALEPLPQLKAYELWILPADGTAPIPAGTFHPDASGSASVIMPDVPKGVPAKGFGVTIEDEGGSQKPTSAIVLAGF